jgi:hypothetical protein
MTAGVARADNALVVDASVAAKWLLTDEAGADCKLQQRVGSLPGVRCLSDWNRWTAEAAGAALRVQSSRVVQL